MFVMSILYILLMFAAPVINPNGGYLSVDFSLKNLIPHFDWKYFSSLSILVFAVGGCEKISPYVNKVEDPSKGFPKSMIFAAIMVIVCAIFGTIAMGMMFDVSLVEANFDSYNANGQYWAFQKLGEYYGVGNLIMIIYAACNAIGQFSTLVVSIDARFVCCLQRGCASVHPDQAVKEEQIRRVHQWYLDGCYPVRFHYPGSGPGSERRYCTASADPVKLGYYADALSVGILRLLHAS